jgi:N-methylhydantoinase A
VGPRSAGAVPGPACYGRGGSEPTVTDANLQLGYLDPDFFLGHELTLDEEAAERALARVGDPLGFDPTEAAAGIFRIVNAAMADGIRVVLADKGYDAREFTLLCFGGAGGVHAPAMIAELGIRRVLVPREAPAFSALGLLLSDVRYDFVQTVLEDLEATSPDVIADALEAMRARGEERLLGTASTDGARLERAADMRYRGQTHELRIALPEAIRSVADIRTAYEDAYAEAFGYLNDPTLIQLVNLRVSATGITPKPSPRWEASSGKRPTAAAARGERPAYFAETGGVLATPCLEGDLLRPGNKLTGPAIVEFPSTTIVVRPGQRVSVDGFRNVVIEAAAP